MMRCSNFVIVFSIVIISSQFQACATAVTLSFNYSYVQRKWNVSLTLNNETALHIITLFIVHYL
jgi:hypothetical protein